MRVILILLFSLIVSATTYAETDPPPSSDHGGAKRILFRDNFEGASQNWILSNEQFAKVIDSGDPSHGRVLELQPAGNNITGTFNRVLGRPLSESVYALMKNSAAWKAYRLEGEFFVPEDGDSYLGFIYHFQDDTRNDFGSIYVIVRQHEAYIRANPHYDGNAGRAIYEEFRVNLKKEDNIIPAKWIKFAAEVEGHTAHFYVGDVDTPRITFDLFDGDGGHVGLQPRSIGQPVWVDNIRVREIERLSYSGPALPDAPRAAATNLVTQWETLGPFERLPKGSEAPPEGGNWQPFTTDMRGAVVLARLLEYRGMKHQAYLRTRLTIEEPAVLEFSTATPLEIWVNGQPAQQHGANVGLFDFRRVSWFDFREGAQVKVQLSPGTNTIVVRVESNYSGVGFFARLNHVTP